MKRVKCSAILYCSNSGSIFLAFMLYYWRHFPNIANVFQIWSTLAGNKELATGFERIKKEKNGLGENRSHTTISMWQQLPKRMWKWSLHQFQLVSYSSLPRRRFLSLQEALRDETKTAARETRVAAATLNNIPLLASKDLSHRWRR